MDAGLNRSAEVILDMCPEEGIEDRKASHPCESAQPNSAVCALCVAHINIASWIQLQSSLIQANEYAIASLLARSSAAVLKMVTMGG